MQSKGPGFKPSWSGSYKWSGRAVGEGGAVGGDGAVGDGESFVGEGDFVDGGECKQNCCFKWSNFSFTFYDIIIRKNDNKLRFKVFSSMKMKGLFRKMLVLSEKSLI